MEAMWSVQRKNTTDHRYVKVWKFKLNRHRSKKRTSVQPRLHTLPWRRMHRKEEAQQGNIRQEDNVFSVCKGRRNTCMGKKSIRRLESKGKTSQKTIKTHKLWRVNWKSLSKNFREKLQKQKQRKRLRNLFSHFHKVVYRIAIWEESQNHCSYSRKCGTKVPRRSVWTYILPWSTVEDTFANHSRF